MAPLKPQQRLYILRTAVIPSYYHLLVLGNTHIGLLKKLDCVIRASVRQWLNLPHDTPNAYFHADAKDGGLSVPSFRWIIPLQRCNRLKNLKIIEDDEVPETMQRFLEEELKRNQLRLKDHTLIIDTLVKCKDRFAKLLHGSNDGGPLRRSHDVENQHRWITDGNLLVSGHDYIHMNKLRINAIPLRVRLARGRVRDKHCRAGCNSTETLNHVLQICARTHVPRIKRHDACLDYLLGQQPKGTCIYKEPRFQTPAGLRKPDAIIKSGNAAIVIDAAIPGERSDLDRVYQDKINYYKNLVDQVRNRYSVRDVTFTSLIISCRGIWSRKSFEHLLRLNLVKRKDANIMSIRALIGGLNELRFFHQSTGVYPCGIG